MCHSQLHKNEFMTITSGDDKFLHLCMFNDCDIDLCGREFLGCVFSNCNITMTGNCNTHTCVLDMRSMDDMTKEHSNFPL